MTVTKAETAERVLHICHHLAEGGLAAGKRGYVSARLSEDAFLITPDGIKFEDMTAEDLVEVRIERLSREGEKKPSDGKKTQARISGERGMHARLYRLRPGCGFIIHTNQTFTSAISVAGKDVQIHYYSDIPEKQIRLLGPVVPCAEYALPSSSRLGENAVLAAKEQPECRAVILRCNGAVCMGVTDYEALETAETLEDVARRVYERRCGEKVLTEAGPEFVSESEGRYRLHIRTPYVMEMSRRAKTLQPYLDEAAEVLGASVRCLRQDPDSAEIRKACKGRSAVLINDDGAICLADTKEEAEEIAAALEKNCLAANLALKKGFSPVKRFSARIERAAYKRKKARS